MSEKHDSMAHAPRLHRYTDPTVRAGTGPDLVVDAGELVTALTGLTHILDGFDPNAPETHGLSVPVPAGTGPVGQVLGHAFNHRLSATGGAVYVARTHHRMLGGVVASLSTTTRRYLDTEECVTKWLCGMTADRATPAGDAAPADDTAGEQDGGA